jgi:hypothetical protein
MTRGPTLSAREKIIWLRFFYSFICKLCARFKIDRDHIVESDNYRDSDFEVRFSFGLPIQGSFWTFSLIITFTTS